MHIVSRIDLLLLRPCSPWGWSLPGPTRKTTAGGSIPPSRRAEWCALPRLRRPAATESSLQGLVQRHQLDDAHYREKHQAPNPNLALIRDLRKSGVELLVCGQALAHAELQSQWVDPNVKLALAALTVLPIYQDRGYALIPE